MLRSWRASPRWTTAHEIYRDLVMAPSAEPNFLDKALYKDFQDDKAAKELAWQVFFSLHVLPYEILKRTENGEVDW